MNNNTQQQLNTDETVDITLTIKNMPKAIVDGTFQATANDAKKMGIPYSPAPYTVVVDFELLEEKGMVAMISGNTVASMATGHAMNEVEKRLNKAVN